MKSPSRIVLLLSVVLVVMIVGGGLLFFGWISERKGVLEGEVFIVAKGGENYKLGLVRVALYSLDTLKPYIDKKSKEVSAAFSQLKPLSSDAANAGINRKAAATESALNAHEADPRRASLEAASRRASEQLLAVYCAYCYLVTRRDDCADFYFIGLPQPIVTTQTDSDGRFKINLPTKGEFVVAASARRSVGESEEHYYWLLKVSLDGSSIKTIMLSNNNLSSAGSPDSLIPTTEEAIHRAKEAMLATTPSPGSAGTQTPTPQFITITRTTEAKIPETFEMIRLKPGQQLRFVSLAGDQVRVQYGKFEAVVDFYATDLSHPSK